jgi:Asp-tRNA(Asn)/Glu-tRNA(Gln) amidotransferase A subunit family amidase
MTRSVDDAMLVLQAIAGPDAGDVSTLRARSTTTPAPA